jgi:hypothetical protein
MTDQPNPKQQFSTSIALNPAPLGDSQAKRDAVQNLLEEIMRVYRELLPSNYVSEVTGPFYTLEFQALAEQIAKLQIEAQEVFADNQVSYTRPEFLYQIIGQLVFPDVASGYPKIEGDLSFRSFLEQMLLILVKGSKATSIQEGLELLTDADISVLETPITYRDRRSNAPLGSQFSLEILVSQDEGTEFPENPALLQENARIVLRALKPAHVLYSYRHLFLETIPVPEDEFFATGSSYNYEDYRKYCGGVKSLSGEGGTTWVDRTLFSDTSRSFEHILPGAELVIHAGLNANTYRVREVLGFVFDDSTPRRYTTSSGLEGLATVSGYSVTDPDQDFASVVEGEVLTFSEGPNLGSYRIDALSGNDGGKLGFVVPVGTYTEVQIAPSLLRLYKRMPRVLTGQSYTVGVDRLGVKTPRLVEGEDVSHFFYSP